MVPGRVLGPSWEGLGSILWPKAKNHQKRQHYYPPFRLPFSTQNRRNLVRGRSRESKVRSGMPPDRRSDFGRLFGAAMGGPMCSIYSTGYIQTTFCLLRKTEFVVACWAPFWSLWPPLGLMLGTCGDTSWKMARPKSDSPKRP